MSRRCAAISPAYASGAKATVRFLANTSGLSEYLPKALAAFLSQHPAHLDRRRGARKRRYRAAPSLTGAADLGLAAEHALPDNIERIPFSEDRLVLVAAARRRTGKPAAGRFQRSGGARLRRPDQLDRAACPCQRARRAARRAPALSRAAEQFRCDRPDGRRRHRRRRDAGSRGKTLRAIDEDQRHPDQGPLGQPAARDLRPQLQVAAAARDSNWSEHLRKSRRADGCDH